MPAKKMGMVLQKIIDAASDPQQQVPGFHFSRVPFRFSRPTKSGSPVPDPDIETEHSLLLNHRIHWESYSGNRCVDPVWAEMSGNVAIYKCLASSLLLRSLPATSAKRL